MWFQTTEESFSKKLRSETTVRGDSNHSVIHHAYLSSVPTRTTVQTIRGREHIIMLEQRQFPRGLCLWQKGPIHMAKEAYAYGKRGLCLWQKRPMRGGPRGGGGGHTRASCKEGACTMSAIVLPSGAARIANGRTLISLAGYPGAGSLSPPTVITTRSSSSRGSKNIFSKSVCAYHNDDWFSFLYVKRRLCIWRSCPMHMAKEAYSCGKRGLCIGQKRPIHVAKETYS